MTEQPLIDPFGRHVTYLRVSVTDRCDFRCVYCMAETMTFLPREDLLSLEEIDRLASAFIARGVRKLRLTGGEPLVRRNIMWLIEQLSRHLGPGLDELTLTTNASQLAQHAEALAACGVARINVSLDTLDPAKFRDITRRGDLAQVLRGIDAAASAGLTIKINTVALRDINEDEIEDLIRWAHGRGFDLTLIETMPMGEIGADRTEQYLPLSLRARAPLPALHPRRHRLPLGRPCALCNCARDRRQARLHHADDPQFLRILQSRARHLHRHTLYVPRPGGCGRSARAAPRQQGRWPASRRDRRRHRAEAEGPRLRHRPGGTACRGAADVVDGRLGTAEIQDFRRFIP